VLSLLCAALCSLKMTSSLTRPPMGADFTSSVPLTLSGGIRATDPRSLERPSREHTGSAYSLYAGPPAEVGAVVSRRPNLFRVKPFSSFRTKTSASLIASITANVADAVRPWTRLVDNTHVN